LKYGRSNVFMLLGFGREAVHTVSVSWECSRTPI
jgi:hypothetical protein